MDGCSWLLGAVTRRWGRGCGVEGVMGGRRRADDEGWLRVLETVTLADDRVGAWYDNPNALGDYFRDIGSVVLAAEGLKDNHSHQN